MDTIKSSSGLGSGLHEHIAIINAATKKRATKAFLK